MLLETIFFLTLGVLGYIAVCIVAATIFVMTVNLVLILLEESVNLILDIATLLRIDDLIIWSFSFLGTWRENQ